MNNPELVALLSKAHWCASGCLIWDLRKNVRGYGLTRFRGKNTTASRAVLSLKIRRPLTDQEYACHECDNPPCVNPDHLFVGSPSDNVKDSIAKGRMLFHKSPKHRQALSEATGRAYATGKLVRLRGEDAPRSVLTERDVLEIRSAVGPQRLIAAHYGVDQTMISAIKRRKYWAHIK